VKRRFSFGRPAKVFCLGIMTLFAAAEAQAQTVQTSRTVRVAGFGEVQARPNRAQLSFAVETTGATAADAASANAELMDRVIRALQSAGVSPTDIETQGYSLYPEYEQPRPPRDGMMVEPQQPRIIGYRAMNQVRARTRQLDAVGQLIDVALEAGANRFDGVFFDLVDSQAEQREAMLRAVASARETAEAIAQGLGVRLGAVLDASTLMDVVQPQPMYAMQRDFGGAPPPPAAPTPIQPGSLTIQARVNVVFEIN
jgi:uncharacterized protein